MAKRKNANAVALGRRGGKATSPAKSAAAKRNAQFAGRKPKFEIGDRVHVKDGAPLAYRGQLGVISAARERARYEVTLEDGVTVPLYSWWLETP